MSKLLQNFISIFRINDMLLNLKTNLTQQEKELKPKKKSDLIYQNVQILQQIMHFKVKLCGEFLKTHKI